MKKKLTEKAVALGVVSWYLVSAFLVAAAPIVVMFLLSFVLEQYYHCPEFPALIAGFVGMVVAFFVNFSVVHEAEVFIFGHQGVFWWYYDFVTFRSK